MAGVASLSLDRGLGFLRSSVQVEPFSVPLAIPPVLRPARSEKGRDYYALTMKERTVEILPGERTRIWGYNGLFPGPTIKVRRGRPIVVRQINRLGTPTTVHLHGGRVSPSNDGHPMDLIKPGAHKDYRYPNRQPASTLWYHDHTHRKTSRNVYMGLAGLYLIEDEAEDELNLPKGRYDIPLVIQDRSFQTGGAFSFNEDHDGMFGDVYLVNGRATPFLKVANRKYRFRLLNASNSRNYDLALSTGLPINQIGSDGGLLSAPYAATSIPIWPAERAEVVIDFSMYPIGTQIVLQDRSAGSNPTEAVPVMRFDIDREEEDPSVVPPELRAIEPLTPGGVERNFDLELDGIRGVWVINGKMFKPDRVDARPRLGDVEVWRFNNVSRLGHPMHIHLAMFQVLDRDGLAPPPSEAGWKDTVSVASSEVVRVAVKFTGHTGRYVFHCHNLPHEDHAMMAQMQVIP